MGPRPARRGPRRHRTLGPGDHGREATHRRRACPAPRRALRDQEGRELFDLPKAPRPAADFEPPVRLLPDYDNILLAHADRTRILPPGRHLGLFSSNGIMKGSVLVDGFVRGAWIPATNGSTTELVITAFEKSIPKAKTQGVEAEGLRLLEFLAPSAKHERSEEHT